MSKNTIQAKDSINQCDKTEVTGIDIGVDQRALSVNDQEAHAILQQIKDCLANPLLKIADEDISALRLLAATSATNVELAEASGGSAMVIGVSRTAGNSGATIEIIQSGEVSDSSFNFPVDTKLFLGADGMITDVVPTAPSSEYLVRIGHSLGSGRIFLNIETPIRLTT